MEKVSRMLQRFSRNTKGSGRRGGEAGSRRKAWQGIQAAARGEGRSHGAAANESGEK